MLKKLWCLIAGHDMEKTFIYGSQRNTFKCKVCKYEDVSFFCYETGEINYKPIENCDRVQWFREDHFGGRKI